MSLKRELKRYYRKISWGLIGYRARKNVVKELKNRVSEFLKLRPDATIEIIHAEFGRPKEVIDVQKRNGRSDFCLSVKNAKPYEWAVVIIGVLLVAWLIYCAFGGTIG